MGEKKHEKKKKKKRMKKKGFINERNDESSKRDNIADSVIAHDCAPVNARRY
jgi:hypothetical protein